MAKVWSTLTDGYSNEQKLAESFINGVAWVRDSVHMIQLPEWYGYHVEGSISTKPDVLDQANKAETTALCEQYGIDMTDKQKWIVIAELREAIGTVIPIITNFKYSYNLNRWLEANALS